MSTLCNGLVNVIFLDLVKYVAQILVSRLAVDIVVLLLELG